jgi:putative tryptophan/tyrosine transport system substrate-binding protein
MRRREFTIGLLLATATQPLQAQERAMQHRIAIVIPASPVASISETGVRAWQAFFEELRRLGDVEGQNLTIDRYSGEGRPEGYADLARQVVGRNPEVICAVTNPVTLAIRAATATIPIVWLGGDPIEAGFATSLARPGSNITGVNVYAGDEIWGKLLQILKETVPSASKVACLGMRGSWEGGQGQALQEAGRQLQISPVVMRLQESTPSEYQRVFAEIARERPDAIMVHAISDLFAYRQLIVELVEKSGLPAIYPGRGYAEVGGLMAYGSDGRELWQRMADDVHDILNGAKPGDIPIYQPSKFEFVINLKAAKALGLTFPAALLALADEVIE